MIVVKIIDRILNFIVFTFFLLVMAFSSYALFDVYSVYEDTELTDDILKYKPSTQGENSFGKKFSLADLKTINPDIVGWIRIDHTNIDYPVLAGVDNSSYLKTDYKGDYSPSGSIFLDYRNSRELDDDFFVIYGHNMAKNLMFSDIKKFQNEEYFNSHPTGKLYTNNGVYDLQIFTFNIIDANKSIAYKLQNNKNGHNSEIIDTLSNSAIFRRDMEIQSDDSFVLLSTCYGVGTYDRSVLLAKMTKSDSSFFIRDQELEEKKKEEAQFEARIIKENKKKNMVSRVFVLIIYIMIAGIIYIRLLIVHRRRKKKKKRKKGTSY